MWKRMSVWVLPMVAMFMPAIVRADVRDGAKIFGAAAVEQADAVISRMDQKYHKDMVVETFAKVPDDQQDALKQQGKTEFFHQWRVSRASELKVNGVFVLVCMDPKYVEVGAGASTKARGIFTDGDISRLRASMQSDFHEGQFDRGLMNGVDLVERTYTANIQPSRSSNGYQGAPSYPTSPNYRTPNPGGGMGMGLGSLVCLGVGALLIFSLIRSALGGRSSYGGNPMYGGSMGPGPGYGYGGGGGGGSGFGSGLLGGLLGGVVGGEADRWMHGGNQSGGSWGGSGGGGSGGGLGGGFDSGPSDAGQGFGSGASGGDFGSSGGGGGGGGSDSGGGF